MTTEATQKGAEEQEVKQEQQEKPKSAREAVVESVVARRRSEMQAKEEEPVEEAAEQDPEQEPEQEPEEPAETPVEAPETNKQDPDLATIKVDGKEQQVPREKVYEVGIRALQKELAADARLAEAANLKRQLEAERIELQREKEIRAMAAKVQQADEKNSHPKRGADEYREIAKAALRAVFDGEEDDAVEQLVRLTAGREHVTPQDLQRMAEDAAKHAKAEVQKELRQEKWNLEAREAKEWFEQEHKDIATDPEWRALADRETADLMTQHPDWFPKQIVKAAAERIERLRKSKGVDRTAAKRQIDSPRTASGRMPAPQEPPPKTRSEYIKEIRRSRGLPV